MNPTYIGYSMGSCVMSDTSVKQMYWMQHYWLLCTLEFMVAWHCRNITMAVCMCHATQYPTNIWFMIQI